MQHKTKPFIEVPAIKPLPRQQNALTLKVQSGMYDHVTLFIDHSVGIFCIKRWCADGSLPPNFELLKLDAHPELRDVYDAQHKAWDLAAVNCLFVGFEFPDVQL